MTRQAGTYGIIALIALAVGMGVGVLITKQKITKANAIIEQLAAQQSQTEDQLQKTNNKVSQYESELIKARNNAVQMNAELARAKADLMRTKSVLDQMAGQSQESAPAAPTAAASTQTPTASSTAAPAIAVVLPAGVRVYVIKDGDSLWKIAATQLGNGVRFEEILKLNPTMKRDGTLAVGSAIKIPAK